MRQTLVEREDGSLLCIAEVAENPLTRMVGLLGRQSLEPDAGLLIQPCSSVHTFWMRFPIDVVYLNRQDVVLKVATLSRYRLSGGGKGARKVIELPAGRAASIGLQAGEQLSFKRTDRVEASTVS